MENLNKLETAVLNRLADKYPVLKTHIPYLKVLNRQITGVGMYVNFVYSGNVEPIKDIRLANSSISTNENIKIKELNYGLGYEVDISNGKIKFIEFITYNELWSGSINEFSFSN